MTVVRDISEIDSFVPTVEQAEIALQQLIDGKHSLHVPPELEDADIVIAAVICEWKRLKEEHAIFCDALERIDKGAPASHWWLREVGNIAREALAKVKGDATT